MTTPLLKKPGLLSDEVHLHVVPLGYLLHKTFGPAFLLWEPETLVEQCELRWGVVDDFMKERIAALVLMLTNSSAWEDWGVFEKCCATIIGEWPIFSFVQPPEAEDIAITIAVLAKLAPHELSKDVQRYIASACLNDGMWYLEPPLHVSQDELDEHDERFGWVRDHGGVKSALGDNDAPTRPYLKNPVTAVDIQVNRALGVRKELARYATEEEGHMKKVQGVLS